MLYEKLAGLSRDCRRMDTSREIVTVRYRFALIFVAFYCSIPYLTPRMSSSVSSRTRPLMPQSMPIIAMHDTSDEPP